MVKVPPAPVSADKKRKAQSFVSKIKRHMTSESRAICRLSVYVDIYGLVLGDVQLSLQLCDHLCVLLVGQMNRVRIGDLKTAAVFKAAFVFRNDMEMQVRQLVSP